MSVFADRLRWRLKGVLDLSEDVVDRLERHYALLEQWNQRINLTSIRNLEEAVDRHYAESLFLGSHIPNSALSVVDVGSGAGFPGTPIAVLRPELAVTLVECHARKAVFLRESTRDLTGVKVCTQRIESLASQFEFAVMRAVAWRDMRRSLPRVANSIAFLLSTEDAAEAAIGLERSFSFEVIPLPWDHRSVVLLGRRTAV